MITTVRGGSLEKWWGEGGEGKSKNKNRAGETEKKISAPEMFEKKNLCRDFSIGKIISWQGLSEVQCKGGPQIWKIKEK